MHATQDALSKDEKKRARKKEHWKISRSRDVTLAETSSFLRRLAGRGEKSRC